MQYICMIHKECRGEHEWTMEVWEPCLVQNAAKESQPEASPSKKKRVNTGKSQRIDHPSFETDC